MHNRPVIFGAAINIHRTGCERLARYIALATTFVACAIMFTSVAVAQNTMMPAAEPTMDTGAPMTEFGNVSFYSQDLGTILRLRYNTESYGQDDQGNFDIGSFQVLTFDTIDAAAFLDGQVTLNETDGVGFNIGVGWRAIDFPPYSMNTGRMDGISLWVDGQHTSEGAFYPQLGLSFESLGEMWDMRANGYLPLGDQEHVGDFAPTGVIGFQGNSLSQLTQAVVDNAFAVGEVEIARRMGAERDAWAFAGPYFLTNDNDDSAGYRVGVRGYAYPDLLLQFAVSNDDVFHTNASFSLQWFVGRTRTDYQPSGDVRDYLRQPVMRNDYVAIQKTTRAGGVALTNPDGDLIRIVHVDSNAAAGGDGTFENPFNQLDLADGAGSQEGDIILAHAQSVFNTGIVLQDNQRLLGEGNNMSFTVATATEGTVTIPETSPGARAEARPMIVAAVGDAITLADANEVANFDIDGNNITARAIASPGTGAGNPNIHDLTIRETTSHGIQFTPQTLTDTDDLDNDTNITEQFVRGNVTINNVTFTDIGGNGVNIDSANADVGSPNVTLQETIALTNITSTNGTGRGINLENTHTGGTATLSNFTWNGGTTSQGGLRMNNIDGMFNASMSNLTNGSTALGTAGVAILGDTDGTLTFANTFIMNNVDSEAAVLVDGRDLISNADSLGGTVTFANAITNDTNHSVIVRNVTTGANVSFNGAITDTGDGLIVDSNTAGQITFGGDLNISVDGATENAILLDTNAVATNIDFTQDIVLTGINGADGFVSNNGGTISAPGTVNSVSVDTGQAVVITGTTVAGGGVHFGDVNRTGSGALNAIQLENNLGGPITIGNTTDGQGDAGTIAAGTANAVRIANSANVTITGLTIQNGALRTGVEVVKSNTAAMTTVLNDLLINDGATGISTTGGGTGALTMQVNDSNINNATAQGMLFNNVDNTGATPIDVKNVVIDGGNVNATADGIRINDSNGSITFDSATITQNVGGDNIEISGATAGAGTISYNGQIINTDAGGRSVNIHNNAAGTVTFSSTSSINDTNQGILVDNNTGGTYTFNGNNDLNTAANDAVTLTNNAGATISMTDLDIDTTSGQGFVATGGGTLTVSGFSNTIRRTAGVTDSALQIEGMTIGAVDFESVNATGGQNGIRLVDNTGGTVTVGDAGNAAGQGGTITGTSDQGVFVQNTNVALNGVTVTNAGDAAGENAVEINHTGATNMAANLNRLTVTNNANPARDGVSIDGSGGAGTFTANVQNMTLTASGNGFSANQGVTLTAGGTNTITSADGVGLSLTDIAIDGAGANFQSVNVNASATNGIRMENVTGGQVAVTGVGTTIDSGGNLTTTGSAIVLSNVANVDLRNVHVVSSGGAAGGIDIDHTGAATSAMDVTLLNLNLDTTTADGINVLASNATNAFNLRINNSDIDERVVMSHTAAGNFGLLLDNTNITTTGTDTAFQLSFSGTATDADVTIRNGSSINAANASALVFTATNASSDIEFAISGSTFTNNSAASQTTSFLANGSATVDFDIVNNTFNNSNTADRFAMTSDGPATQINLNLNGNTANGDIELTTANRGAGFNFGVVDRDDADANNGNNVNFNPLITDFEDIVGPVEPPTVP
jgi:hypothetical protein